VSPATPLVIAADAWVGDRFGGAYKIASELAMFAAQGGRDVHYVCAAVDGRTGMASESGVTLWRYAPAPAGSGAWRRYRGHLQGASAALRLAAARIGRPFVLNGHGPLPYFAALRCRDLPLSRRVMSVHSPLAEEYAANCGGHMGPLQALAHTAFRSIERRCYAGSDAIQCFSRFIAGRIEAAATRPTPKVTVCPGYVDYAPMALDMPRAEARRRLQLPFWQTGQTCFFSLRRHAPRMGLDRLVRAFARVRREAPQRPCRLILGGDGPQTAMLRELARELGIENEVHFAGRIDEAVKALHYRAADCFVLPTIALEGFGLIVLEAFAAGTPVIATPVGAIPEVVDGHGVLTEGADEQSIARAMLAFLASGPAGDEAARRDYAKSFDKAVVLPRLEGVVMGEAA